MGFINEQSMLLTLLCGFRPLTGHGFHRAGAQVEKGAIKVSVPLRGMGFIMSQAQFEQLKSVSVPLRGMGFIIEWHRQAYRELLVSVPLRGMGFISRIP